MLLWISILGDFVIMMGHHARSETLFYYFCLEDQVPENYLLRLIDKHFLFEFVREQLKDSYSETGRPSIDPESEQFFLAAAAQNIKRLVRFISQPTPHNLPTTAYP